LFAVLVAIVLLLACVWLLQDPWHEFCTESARDLPAVIPQRLVVDVVGEDRERLAGETRLTVEAGLRDALDVYNFSNRIFLAFEDNETEARPGDHVMELRVYLRDGIPITRIASAAGRMCGNIVLVQLAGDPAVSRLRFIHEFGHYFGLPHEAGTYMRTAELVPDPAADRFSPGQLGILDVWNHPGAGYVPHWAR